MELSNYFKSIVDQDRCAVVICNLEHIIIYMNPAAVQKYAQRGGANLQGKSLLDCHSKESVDKIKKCLSWFMESPLNNLVYEFHNEKENKDVYMVALRDEDKLIGYYEKHEYKDAETMKRYDI